MAEGSKKIKLREKCGGLGFLTVRPASPLNETSKQKGKCYVKTGMLLTVAPKRSDLYNSTPSGRVC